MSFGYGEEDTGTQAMSVSSLQPGRVLGLLGRTGSGKTTLTRAAVPASMTLAGAR